MPPARHGLSYGVAAYLLWGMFPLYWPLLEPAGPVEMLGQRIVWSTLTMGVLVVALRRTAQLRAILRDRRVMLLLVVAALTVTSNWATYIYGVTNERVVETSLGYFINPLVTVLLGVVVLGERLRPLQWVAVGVGFAAVGVLTWDYGHLPYVALVLAFSFGTYGLAKKSANVGAIESLAFETSVIAPFAAAYLVWLTATGGSHFGTEGVGHAALMVSSGLITAVPLMLFGAAATRLSLVAIGLLQYLAPIIQFALGVVVFDEAMPTGRWIGFALVWVALTLFTVEAIRHRRRQIALTVATAAAA
ncbi:EamA family transporter RarD [Nocardioides sp. R-C-SC26]|uniref:EamA family transporter RarD n=1 Tax=Nocardioides sp. R-C-SC26 TaxID=2870414 RepID=UPI001E44EC06|nr:EamA family transporter RarD [Nocardioides sp. R-C-SC26]